MHFGMAAKMKGMTPTVDPENVLKGSNLVSSRRRHAKPSVDFASYVKIARNDPDGRARNDPDIDNALEIFGNVLNLAPLV